MRKTKSVKVVDCIYCDGEKDDILVELFGPNGKLYKSVELEKYYVVVGQAGKFCLFHI